MDKKNVMQDELLNKVAGGVEICQPSGNDNTKQYTDEELDRLWNVVKQRQEWKFRTKELELQAKKMWIDAGLEVIKIAVDVAKLTVGGK